MPNYDYQCEKCGHHFEVFQSMNDAKLTDCPLDACDGVVKRLLGTGAGLIFKGAGFYQTDYRSASYQAGVKTESSGGGDSSKKSAPAAAPAKESKPAAASTPA
ncbi:MAG: FmdB family zinc ribbon protein [Luteolibacter sp.]|jgi:putative FmdB family regulatory protein